MKTIVLATIRFYQDHVSPGMRPTCRFSPTCSQYALESVERYGAVRGSFMGAWRIARCNPLNDGGYDPVPERQPRSEGSRA